MDELTNARPVDEVRELWEFYRSATFMPVGTTVGGLTVWLWAAAYPFDFVVAGSHLAEEPSMQIDVGTKALSVIAYGALHLIPLTTLAPGALDALQSRLSFDYVARQRELLEWQQASERMLKERVSGMVETVLVQGGAYGPLH